MRRHILIGMLGMGGLQADSEIAQAPVSQEKVNPPPSSAYNYCIPRYENNFFASADVLCWLAKQEGNDFAATGSAITVPGTTDPNTGLVPGSVSQGSVYAPDPEVKAGLKVAAGVNFAHDNWDLIAEYTYFYGSADKSVSSSNLNAGIIPLLGYTPNNSILSEASFAGGSAGYVSYASGNWSLHFNNINLELGKTLFLTPYFYLRPHFGLQGSWQDQHFHAHYVVTSIAAPATDLGDNRITYHQTFWGIGPRVGLDGTWQCCKHFGLFASSGLSALWGQFKGRSSSTDNNSVVGYDDVLIANQVNRPHTLSPVAQLEIGVQTDWIVWDHYRILAQAGWEGQIWFFQNQHSSSIADTSLVLQGLTLGLRADF